MLRIGVDQMRSLVDRIVADEEMFGLPEFMEYVEQGFQTAADDADIYRKMEFVWDDGTTGALLEFIQDNPDHPIVIQTLEALRTDEFASESEDDPLET